MPYIAFRAVSAFARTPFPHRIARDTVHQDRGRWAPRHRRPSRWPDRRPFRQLIRRNPRHPGHAGRAAPGPARRPALPTHEGSPLGTCVPVQGIRPSVGLATDRQKRGRKSRMRVRKVVNLSHLAAASRDGRVRKDVAVTGGPARPPANPTIASFRGKGAARSIGVLGAVKRRAIGPARAGRASQDHLSCATGVVPAWRACSLRACPVSACPVSACPVSACPVSACPVSACSAGRPPDPPARR